MLDCRVAGGYRYAVYMIDNTLYRYNTYYIMWVPTDKERGSEGDGGPTSCSRSDSAAIGD